MKKIFAIIPNIMEGKNRTQYQHMKAICEKFDVTILLRKDSIPDEIKKKAELKIFFSSKQAFVPLYMLWVVMVCLFSRSQRPIVYTTYNLYSSICGFVLKLFGFRWLADIWDDPYLGIATSFNVEKKSFALLLPVFKIPYFFVKNTLKYADLTVMSISPEITRKYGIKEGKTVFLTNGTLGFTRPGRTKKKKGGFRIVYVGQVKKSRGIGTLLESAVKLRHEIPNMEIKIVGPCLKGESSWLRKEIKKQGLGNLVEVTGEVSHEDALSYEETADVCVFTFPMRPELEYIYPIKIFEYMSMRKAIVATRLFGVSRIINHGQNGLLANPSDSDDLARKIRILFENPDLREKLAGRAQGDVKKYYWENINRQFVEAIDEFSSLH